MNGARKPSLHTYRETKHEAGCKHTKKPSSNTYRIKKKHEVRPILALLHVKYCPIIKIQPILYVIFNRNPTRMAILLEWPFY